MEYTTALNSVNSLTTATRTWNQSVLFDQGPFFSSIFGRFQKKQKEELVGIHHLNFEMTIP